MVNLPTSSIKKTQLKLGKKFKLNGWLIFDGIVLIIIVGVLAVRFTRASVDSTFARNPEQMSSGTLQRSVAGGEFRHIAANDVHAEANAPVIATEIAASRQVCAQMHTNTANTFVDIQINGHYATKFIASAGDVTVCVDVHNENKGGVIYAGTSGDANVYSIYGIR